MVLYGAVAVRFVVTNFPPLMAVKAVASISLSIWGTAINQL
jgi:hypothetical protein